MKIVSLKIPNDLPSSHNDSMEQKGFSEEKSENDPFAHLQSKKSNIKQKSDQEMNLKTYKSNSIEIQSLRLNENVFQYIEEIRRKRKKSLFSHFSSKGDSRGSSGTNKRRSDSKTRNSIFSSTPYIDLRNKNINKNEQIQLLGKLEKFKDELNKNKAE